MWAGFGHAVSAIGGAAVGWCPRAQPAAPARRGAAAVRTRPPRPRRCAPSCAQHGLEIARTHEFERLGAAPAAKLARDRLRALGAPVPRGPRPTTRANPADLTSR